MLVAPSYVIFYEIAFHCFSHRYLLLAAITSLKFVVHHVKSLTLNQCSTGISLLSLIKSPFTIPIINNIIDIIITIMNTVIIIIIINLR